MTVIAEFSFSRTAAVMEPQCAVTADAVGSWYFGPTCTSLVPYVYIGPMWPQTSLRIGHGSVSVFQVGIGFSVYLSVFFSSRFGIWCRYYKISRYRFGIFGIHFASKRHVRILKFCLRISPQIWPKINQCPRGRRWQKLTVHCPHKRRLTDGRGWDYFSSLDASNQKN